jgi:proteasome lid subunit RPN8/RPN11
MKILKLQSDNTISLSQFTNNLQIPLQLNRQAKVALKTLSFEFQPTTIDINSLNDYLTYSINSIKHFIGVKTGKYNIRELCELMTIYINELVNSDDAAAEGTEFLADYTGNAKDGYLFVDEIDTGLHFTAMSDMWKMIWDTAKKLNVQVFATTHNSDCWKSLADIAEQEDVTDYGIRIHRIEKGKEKSIVFNEAQIVIAAERELEVR